jgi:hypothetical protein
VFNNSCCNETVIAKNFGSPPAPNTCKPLTGFALPFFSLAHGSVCTSAGGQTMYFAASNDRHPVVWSRLVERNDTSSFAEHRDGKHSRRRCW